MLRRLILLLWLGSFCLHSNVLAQDDGDKDVDYEVSVWRMNSIDEDGNTEEFTSHQGVPYVTIVITLENQDTIILASAGTDGIYTLNSEGIFEGVELIPTGFDFTETFTIVDDETIDWLSISSTGYENRLRFTSLDENYLLYTESTRTISEYSLYKECVSETDAELGNLWTRPDLLAPIFIDEETQILYWNGIDFIGREQTFTDTELRSFQGTDTKITQTFRLNEDNTLSFRYHEIQDGRDDCEMIYESVFIAFDGDFEALFEQAESIYESEQQPKRESQ